MLFTDEIFCKGWSMSPVDVCIGFKRLSADVNIYENIPPVRKEYHHPEQKVLRNCHKLRLSPLRRGESALPLPGDGFIPSDL